MKYIERLKIEHPEAIDSYFMGGAMGCPCSYGYTKYHCGYEAMHCEACWNQEAPPRKVKVRRKK